LGDILVGIDASNNRSGGIHHVHRLTAPAEIAARVGRLPGSGRIESRSAVTSHVRHGADDGDGIAATVVSCRWRIEAPGIAKLDGFVRAWAGNHRGGCVGHRHRLAAAREVGATIRRLPCACRIERASAMAGGVGYGADNRNRVGATVVGCRRSIKGPSGPELDALVGAGANDYWRARVHHRYGLAALRVVAAAIGCTPGARCVKSAAAMASGVGNGAENSYGNVAAQAVVGRRRSVEGPGRPQFDGLVGARGAIHYRRRRINDVDVLAAAAEIAASIGCLPRPRRIKCVCAVAHQVRDGAHHSNSIAAAVVGGRWWIKRPGAAQKDSFIAVDASDYGSRSVLNHHGLAAA